MHIITLSESAPLKRRAGELLNDYLVQFKLSPILLLLSGGSALELLETVQKDNLGSHITITMLDDRYSNEESINNFSQLTQTKFYDVAVEQGCRFISTQARENESMADLANRFETSLRAWGESHPNHIKLTTMGIGPDGHTAGIFPYPDTPARFSELFIDTDHWVTSYNAQGRDPHPLRITVTLPFLKMIDYAVAYAVGPNKVGAMKRTLAQTGTPAETPARLLLSMPHVTLFTDYKEEKGKEKPLKL